MADVQQYTTVARPRDYWMSPKALSITRNALGEANRIAASVTGGSQFFCHFENIGDVQAETLFGYDVAHNFRSWPLNISQTFFNTNEAILPHIAIPRRDKSDAKAMVVFPTERLDLWGYATDAVPMQDEDGNYINDKGEIVRTAAEAATAYVRKKKTGTDIDADPIGSQDYYYIYLQGRLTASGAAGTTPREWDPMYATGLLNTDETWGEVITLEQLAREMKKKVDVEWFQRVFTIHGTDRQRVPKEYDDDGEVIEWETDDEGNIIYDGEDGERIVRPNDMEHEITDTESMFGTWTEKWISALGKGSGSGGGGGEGGGGGDALDEPLLSINNSGMGLPPMPGTGKIAIVYNYETKRYEWGKTGGGLSGLTLMDRNDVLDKTESGDSVTYNLGEAFLSLKYGGTVRGNVTISGASLDITPRPEGFDLDTAAPTTVLTKGETETLFAGKYVTVKFFEDLFELHMGDANNTKILTNTDLSTYTAQQRALFNIKAMFGTWTEQYLSALGMGSDGSGGGVAYLSLLEDVSVGTLTPQDNGKALIYDSTLDKWVKGTAGIDTNQLNTILQEKTLKIMDGTTQLGSEWNARDGGSIDISDLLTRKTWWGRIINNDGKVRGDIEDADNIYVNMGKGIYMQDSNGNKYNVFNISQPGGSYAGNELFVGYGLIKNSYTKYYNLNLYGSTIKHQYGVSENNPDGFWTVFREDGHVTINASDDTDTTRNIFLNVGGSTKTNRLYLFTSSSGDVYLEYDNVNKGVRIVNAGLYADTYVSALGTGSDGTPGGIDLEAMWDSLTHHNDSFGSSQIDANHLKNVTHKLTGTVNGNSFSYDGTSDVPLGEIGGDMSNLFTKLENDGDKISVTVGGTNKELTVGYATTANKLRNIDMSSGDNYDALGGYTKERGSFVATNWLTEANGFNSITLDGKGLYDTLVSFGYNNRTIQLKGSGWSDDLKYRHVYTKPGTTNEYVLSPWKTIAFTDSTVAKAERLSGDDAKKAWGRTYWNGGQPQDVEGNIENTFGITPKNTNTYSIGTRTNWYASLYASYLNMPDGASGVGNDFNIRWWNSLMNGESESRRVVAMYAWEEIDGNGTGADIILGSTDPKYGLYIDQKNFSVGICTDSLPTDTRLYVNGNIRAGGKNGNWIQIGQLRIVYEDSTRSLKVVDASNYSAAANFYATGAVSALGMGSTGGASVFDEEQMWEALGGSMSNQVIKQDHLNLTGYALTADVTKALTIKQEGKSDIVYNGTEAKEITIGSGVGDRLQQYTLNDGASLATFTHTTDLIYTAKGGGNGCLDKPDNVDAFGLISFKTAVGYFGQMLMPAGVGRLYLRSSNSLNGGWNEVALTSDLTSYAKKADIKKLTVKIWAETQGFEYSPGKDDATLTFKAADNSGISVARSTGTITIGLDASTITAGKATQLASKVTLWGNEFNGTQSIGYKDTSEHTASLSYVQDITMSGNVKMNRGQFIQMYVNDGYRNVLGTDYSDSILSLGYRTAEQGFDTRIFGTDVRLWYYNATDKWKEGVTLTNAGKVGIGTTDPQYRLDVNGTAHVSSDITAGSDILMENNKFIRIKNAPAQGATAEYVNMIGLDSSNRFSVFYGALKKQYTTGIYGYDVNIGHGNDSGQDGAKYFTVFRNNGHVTINAYDDTDATRNVFLNVGGSTKTSRLYLSDSIYLVVENNGVHVVGGGLYADTFVSALGTGSTSTPSTFDEEQMWDALGKNAVPYKDKKIDNGHLNLSSLTIITKNNQITYNPTGDARTVDLSNLTGDYLPLNIPSGGSTVTMPSIGGLTIKNSASDYPLIRFEGNAGGGLGFIGVGKTGDTIAPYFVTTVNGVYVDSKDNPNNYSQWYTLLHTGNWSSTITLSSLGAASATTLNNFINNSSVSKSGEKLTVKINGVSQSLENTWRGIQDSLNSDSTTDSLSAKKGKELYGYITKLQGYFDNGVAKSAAKLTTVSKKLWGNTYWTSDGVPTDIGTSSSNASLNYVQDITMSGSLNMARNKYINFYLGDKYVPALGVFGNYDVLEMGYETANQKSYQTNIYGNTIELYSKVSGNITKGFSLNTSGNVCIGNASPSSTVGDILALSPASSSSYTAILYYRPSGYASWSVAANNSNNFYWYTWGGGVSGTAMSLTNSGSLTLGSGNGTFIQIGGARIVWDSTNKALKVIRSDNSTAANFYATGAVSALGTGSGGSGGGGMTEDQMWTALSTNDETHRIHNSHINLNTLTLFVGGGKSYTYGGQTTTTNVNLYEDFVTLGTQQTITGVKTFSGNVSMNGKVLLSTTNHHVDDKLYVKGQTHIEGKLILGDYTKKNDSYKFWVESGYSCFGGNVGIGGYNSSYKLYVSGNAYVSELKIGSNIRLYPTTVASNADVLDISAAGLRLNGTNITSDMRKKDVVSIVDDLTLENVARAPIFNFKWKQWPDGLTYVGTSAQYWQNVLPNAVLNLDDVLSLDYGATALAAAVMTARTVLTHDEEIARLKQRIGELEQEIETLKAA